MLTNTTDNSFSCIRIFFRNTILLSFPFFSPLLLDILNSNTCASDYNCCRFESIYIWWYGWWSSVDGALSILPRKLARKFQPIISMNCYRYTQSWNYSIFSQVHVTILDLVLCSFIAPFWVYNDMSARGWWGFYSEKCFTIISMDV